MIFKKIHRLESFRNISLFVTLNESISSEHIKMLEYLVHFTVLIWSWNQSIRTCPSMKRITYIYIYMYFYSSHLHHTHRLGTTSFFRCFTRLSCLHMTIYPFRLDLLYISSLESESEPAKSAEGILIFFLYFFSSFPSFFFFFIFFKAMAITNTSIVHILRTVHGFYSFFSWNFISITAL